jgi:predicted nucleic acid-binding protein
MWSLEVANVLVLAVRRGKITLAERSEFLKILALHPVHTDHRTGDISFGPIVTLADQYRLTAYDAAYLELAMRLGVPLATLDAELKSAARKAGVALL